MHSQKKNIYGEFALIIILLINSLGVVLMLHSNSGISAISSVPYAFFKVTSYFSLGFWTYLFQSLLILALMILRKKIVIEYILSFFVGIAFSFMIDFHQSWVSLLPQTPILQIIYFLISYIILCIGIALSNHCLMPIIPTDLFPRELCQIIKKPYSNVKITFDVSCLSLTVLLTLGYLGYIDGLGIGTVLAALTMGKTIGFFNHLIEKRFTFSRYLTKQKLSF